MLRNSIRSFTRFGLVILAVLGLTACSQKDEAPTEERLMAEKFDRLTAADGEKQGGAVTEQELKTWTGRFSAWKEDSSPEVYESWKACMDKAELFEQAEECFDIIDPQTQENEEKEEPKTVEQVCVVLASLARVEGRAHEPRMDTAYCRQDMERLQHAILGSWHAFGVCASEAGNTLAFDGCQLDALPRPQEHCTKIIAIRTDWEEILPPDATAQCAARVDAKRASLPRPENKIDLSCCLNYAKSPTDIDDCMKATSPRCSPD